jgi:hypothetical protein
MPANYTMSDACAAPLLRASVLPNLVFVEVGQ